MGCLDRGVDCRFRATVLLAVVSVILVVMVPTASALCAKTANYDCSSDCQNDVGVGSQGGVTGVIICLDGITCKIAGVGPCGGDQAVGAETE